MSNAFELTEIYVKAAVNELLPNYDTSNKVDKLAMACLDQLILSFYDVDPETIRDSMELILPNSVMLNHLTAAMKEEE